MAGVALTGSAAAASMFFVTGSNWQLGAGLLFVANTVPEIDSTPRRTARIGRLWSYLVRGTDADGNVLETWTYGAEDNLVAFQQDFDDFRSVIDTLGGITIDVPEPILSNRFDCPYATDARCQQWQGWRFEKGKQEMSGKRALIYSRVRENRLDPAENDLTRGERWGAAPKDDDPLTHDRRQLGTPQCRLLRKSSHDALLELCGLHYSLLSYSRRRFREGRDRTSLDMPGSSFASSMSAHASIAAPMNGSSSA